MNRSGQISSAGPACRACCSRQPRNLGPLAYIEGLFALPTPGELYHCRQCGLYFRHPFLSADQLLACYQTSAASSWDFPGQRRDFALARDMILKRLPSGNVLDVGCFRGDFLHLLPERFTRYGLEPSQDAARTAAARGVEIVGNAIQTFECSRRRFDAITLIDVLEHLVHPLDALKKLVCGLKQDGLLIIATANINALPWRLMRNDYWYYYTEHVSFFSLKWFLWAARHLNLTVVEQRRFSHFNGPTHLKWRQLSQALVFWLHKNRKRFWISMEPLFRMEPFNRVRRWDIAPRTRLWKDHLMVVMQPSPFSNHPARQA